MQWVRRYGKLSVVMVRKSFKGCGVTNVMCGTEDKLSNSDVEDDSDPFSDIPTEELTPVNYSVELDTDEETDTGPHEDS